MLRKSRKVTSLVLCLTLLLAFSNPVLAADIYYNISQTTDSFYEFEVPGWPSTNKPAYFYFGIDTTRTGSAVSVSGGVDTY